MTQPDSAGFRPVLAGIDRVMAVQRPVVLAHIRTIRSRLRRRARGAPAHPGAPLPGRRDHRRCRGRGDRPIPAVGTGTALALSGVETAGFLEATALFAQSVTEIHGIAVDDPDGPGRS